MRFAHTADCHIGGHRDPRLRKLTEDAFERFVTITIDEKVDFAIISGDLFNTAIPGIEALRFAVKQLDRLRKAGIPVYAIAGSHDYSPSGKTMISVLEQAGLLVNVCKGTVTDDGKLRLRFTQDEKTGVKLTGVLGRRGSLDREIYEDLDQSISEEPGEKIFLFHAALTELKPKDLGNTQSQPLSFLPKGFRYYAGGHVHIVARYSESGYDNIVYPGPLFPNSFSELEELGNGGFSIYEAGTITRREIGIKAVATILVDVSGMTGKDAADALMRASESATVTDAIALLRVTGKLSSGSPNDVNVRQAVRILEEKGAYCVLRNTSKLSADDFTSVRVRHEEPKDIEASLLEEHAEQLSLDVCDGHDLAKNLLKALSREQREGERAYEYRESIMQEALGIIESRVGS